MPLRRQVLIPCSEVLGVGRAGGGAVAPDRGIAGVQRAVGDDGDRLAQRRHAEVPTPDISQVLAGDARSEARHALQPGIGAEAVQAEQQARSQHGSIEVLVGRRALECIGEVEPQIGSP